MNVYVVWLQFDLVCDYASLASTITAVYLTGQVVSCLVFGGLIDTWEKIVFIIYTLECFFSSDNKLLLTEYWTISANGAGIDQEIKPKGNTRA